MSSMELKAYQYRRMLEEKRGNNFEYWKDEKHYQMLENGWKLHDFKERRRGVMHGRRATSSITSAKEIVSQLRNDNNFARIVCGYEKNAQRVKMYSVIYKPKI